MWADDRDDDDLKHQGKETGEVRYDLMHLVRKGGKERLASGWLFFI